MTINAIGQDVSNATRNVVLRHPRRFEGIAWRKVALRENQGFLGGAMVLSTEDEPEFDYTRLGEARLVLVDQYAGASPLVDNQSSVDYATPSLFALIEALAEPESEGYFTPVKNDIIQLIIGEGVSIAFEVTDIAGTFGFRSMGKKYELTKRDDLDYTSLSS